MSDPYDCPEYDAFRADRTVCVHGSQRCKCADCECYVLGEIVERLTARNAELEADNR